MPRDPFDTPAISMSAAEKTMNKASAALDKVLANPKATVKQISNAMDKLNAATDKYAQSIISSLSTPSPAQTISVSEPIIGEKVNPVPLSTSLIDTSSGSSSIVATISAPKPIKTATPDIILFDDSTVPVEVITDLIFENIGGQELINIARSDTVNGQKITYQPIKNLSSLQQQYNPNNILSVSDTANRYFAGFSIKLEDKIPNVANGLNGENVYIDPETGDINIDLVNLQGDEQVEIQIVTDGTIYEADI